MHRTHRPAVKSEFDQKIVDIARVTRVVAGGKRMRFRASVIVGDGKGRVGFAVKKGADVSGAINKAVTAAKKTLVTVPIVNETIPHEIKSKFGAAVVLLKPASKGRGVIAGSSVRMIMELVGIKNIVSKMLGSNNKLNNARATIQGLSSLMPPKKVADDKSEKKIEKTEEINSDDK
ncbi:30S ribosomal protein S5 [Patescibacteria group bacterium]